MRAWLNLRHTDDTRAQLFEHGLSACGYQPRHGLPTDPAPGDIFVTWNRIGAGNNVARLFESRRLPVLVVENASWGNEFAGDRWYHIARNYHNMAAGAHNTAGQFLVGGPERWDSLGVTLAPWRHLPAGQGETVILPQRGIGSEPVKMPASFTRKALKRHGGRVRSHPGKRPAVPLEQDLASCDHVVTWGSGAAIKALMWGIAVTSAMPGWIGEQDNTNPGRLTMFQHLAWAQWRHSEIAAGDPFRRLLSVEIWKR